MSDADKPEDREADAPEADAPGARPEDEILNETSEEAATPADEPVAPEPTPEAEPPLEPAANEPVETNWTEEPELPLAAEETFGEVEPVASDPVQSEPVLAAAPAAAAATTPIWSDAGDAPDEPAPVRPEKAKDANEVVEIVKTVFYALMIALVLRVVLFQPFTIPSGSMEPNLYEGDYIVVSKWSYGYSRHSIPFSPPLFEGRIMGSVPERGDIAVFKLPSDNRTDYIKRVIGLPGDRVQMIGGVLHINNAAVDTAVVGEGELEGVFGAQRFTTVRETLPGGASFDTQDFGRNYSDLDNTPAYEVPPGHYFMMGDNRDNSIDSRVPMEGGVGMVPHENLVGKAQIILFSWEPGASLLNPVSWFANVRPSRFFTVLE